MSRRRFQAYDPHPIVVRHAAGSRIDDVDGNDYVDFDMGFGALFAGHMHPAGARARSRSSSTTARSTSRPCELERRRRRAARRALRAADVAVHQLAAPRRRWTPSASPAASPVATKIVKVEGGYHGHHDEVMISMKPPLDEAGPADAPDAGPGDRRASRSGVLADTIVIPYNDPAALERALAGRRRRRASSSSR